MRRVEWDDVNEMSASLLNFTQGSLTYCENKVKSKSKLELLIPLRKKIFYKIVSELRAYGGCLGSWRR